MPIPFPPKVNHHVHILGQPCTVFECVPMATVLCSCHEDNRPFVIPGIDIMKICQRCRNVYAIVGVTFDRRNGPGCIVAVDVVGKADQSPQAS